MGVFRRGRGKVIASQIAIAAIVSLSIALMLLRPGGKPEVVWVGSGAALLILFRLIPLSLAGDAIAEGTDVYLFLMGMMLLSGLAGHHGVFDWLSAAALRRANGSAGRLFSLVYALGIIVTIFLSNDATAVVLTPAILAAVRRGGSAEQKATPLPHLFACALIANAASFVLPISNPANLVVFGSAMPPLTRWLAAFTLPSILSIAVTYLVLRLLFRKDLRGSIAAAPEAKPLPSSGRLVLAGTAFTAAALLTASALGRDLGLPTCLAALAITAAVSIRTRTNPLQHAREISWSTLALVAALFILVDAVRQIGALHDTQAALAWVQGLPRVPAALITACVVGVANNVVNNLPLGLIAGATLTAAHTHGLLANVVLIGVDLGPNLSVTGSLATILWLLALRKQGLEVSFTGFLKVGAIAMPLALLAATAAAIAQSLLLGSG